MSQESRLAGLADEIDATLKSLGLTPPEGPVSARRYPAEVVGQSGDDVFVELGPRLSGVVPFVEFDEEPKVGDTVEVSLVGREDDLIKCSVKAAKSLAAWDEMEVGSLVKVEVVGVNKGGLEGKAGAISAFVPASQVALHRVEDLAEYAGQTLVCEAVEIDRENRRVVASRRAVLEAEEERRRNEGVGRLEPGSVARGKVLRLESWGAFVSLGHGIEGLLHVSNMSHRRVEKAEEFVQVGQELDVMILSIEEGGKRIGLGTKQLEPDPWEQAASRLTDDEVVTGRVQRLVDFGAFVEVLPGVEGLLHVSEMGEGRIQRPHGVISVGQEVPVRVLKIDQSARRLSLTRLDPRGHLIGSDEAAAGEDVDKVLSDSGEKSIGTNLGALFKKALDDKG